MVEPSHVLDSRGAALADSGWREPPHRSTAAVWRSAGRVPAQFAPLALAPDTAERSADIEDLYHLRCAAWRRVDRLEAQGDRRGADRAVRAAHRLEQRIVETPSRSLRDMAVKVVILDEQLGGEPCFDELRITPSIVADARRILGA